MYVHACRGVHVVVSDNYSQNMYTQKRPGCLGSCISSDDIIIYRALDRQVSLFSGVILTCDSAVSLSQLNILCVVSLIFCVLLSLCSYK